MDEVLQGLRRRALAGDVDALRSLEAAVRRFAPTPEVVEEDARRLARLLVTCRFETPEERRNSRTATVRPPALMQPCVVRLAGWAIEDFPPGVSRGASPLGPSWDGQDMVRRLEDAVAHLIECMDRCVLDLLPPHGAPAASDATLGPPFLADADELGTRTIARAIGMILETPRVPPHGNVFGVRPGDMP